MENIGMSMNDYAPLDFGDLRCSNRRRQKEWPGNEQCDLAFKTIEFAGEAGELANKVKKYLRKIRGIKGSTATLQEIEEEMGDIVICLDLLADELGIDLGQAVIDKFNKTSAMNGLTTGL